MGLGLGLGLGLGPGPGEGSLAAGQRTLTTCPGSSDDCGTSTVASCGPMPFSSPTTRWAVAGCSVSSCETASEARPLAACGVERRGGGW